jgi:hypothetical protein
MQAPQRNARLRYNRAQVFLSIFLEIFFRNFDLESPMNRRPLHFVLTAAFLALTTVSLLRSQTPAAATPEPEAILKPTEVNPKLLPEKVFFRGQSAPVQQRNSGGVRFADGYFFLIALVDNTGYSSGVREKYQGYLITEVPLEIAGHTLKPGAYGWGFLEGNKFVVMDVGANDVLNGTSTKDAEMKRPMPLQVLAAKDTGKYRLYHGREYVEFWRAK